MMRAIVAIVIFLSIIPSCLASNHDGELKSLYDNNRWFELRDAVAKWGAPAFYQGAAVCAFNDLKQCQKELRSALKSSLPPDLAVEAHKILINAYFLRGENRRALAQMDAVLALNPDAADVLENRPLVSMLAEFPDQKAAPHHTVVSLSDDGLPFTINGVRGTYWFDTGAELSVISESDAKRFGLTVRDVPVKVGDLNGTKVGVRVAIADDLRLGSVRIEHVAFLVFPDSGPPFNEQKPGSRGLIGLPVLQALQRFTWGMDKTFEIDPKPLAKNVPHAELAFHGTTPITQVQHDGHAITFTLDTGATTTDLYPPFAAAFPDLIRSATKTNSYKMEGVGGAKFVEAANLEMVKLSIGGFPVVLKSTGVLLKPTNDPSKYFAGNLGIDLLQQAHRVTFDFRAMTLTLQ